MCKAIFEIVDDRIGWIIGVVAVKEFTEDDTRDLIYDAGMKEVFNHLVTAWERFINVF